MGDTLHAQAFTVALGYVSKGNIWRLKGAWRAVGQDATLQEGIELVLDELRQVGASSVVLSLRHEGRGVLLHQAVQRGLLRAVALVAEGGAIQPPVGGFRPMARTRGSTNW